MHPQALICDIVNGVRRQCADILIQDVQLGLVFKCHKGHMSWKGFLWEVQASNLFQVMIVLDTEQPDPVCT